MLPRAPAAAVLALCAAAAFAQPADPNLQNLLSSLTTGSEATLVTPLASGMLQVTSFRPGARAAPGAGRGILDPSEDQVRTALVGGTITTINGAVQLPGIFAR